MKTPVILLCFFLLCSLTSYAQNAKDPSLISDMNMVDSFYRFAQRKLMRGKKDSAMLLARIGLSYAEKTGIDSLRIKLLLVEANAANLGGDKKEGILILKKIPPLLSAITPYPLVEKYYNLLGNCYRTNLQYDSALYYFRELEKLNTLNNPYRNWLAFYQIGLTFSQANLLDEAENYFWKSYAISKPKGIRADHGVVLNEFASLLSKKNMPEKFSAILKEYYDLIHRGKKDFSNDPIHGMLFIDWGEYTLEGKVNFMNKVKQTLLKNGDTISAAYANNHIAIFYEREKKPEEALKYIRENLGPLLRDNHIEYQYINSNAAYRLLKKTGNDKEAVLMADAVIRLKDSLTSQYQRALLLDLETKYQSEKKEKEIALLNSQNALNELQLARELEIRKRLQIENILKDTAVSHQKSLNEFLASENILKDARLEKELQLKAALNRENELISNQNQLKESQLSKEKRVRGLLIGSAILLLFSAIAILRLYRKQRIKNNLIQKQADELEVLMKEIHHRVKNNMQIVSSLLDLQSITIKDDQAAEAVKEGKNRVQSMALIHQHLYQEGNIRGIKMDDYINTLAQNLFSSYNISPDRIVFRTDIENLNLDVDTVIPLGLIINELVSNSLKYAFDNTDKGIVSISLKEKNDSLELLVRDDGKGFPTGLDIHKNQSFGLQLITAFAKKLKARLDFYNDNGAAVYMQIKKFRFA